MDPEVTGKSGGSTLTSRFVDAVKNLRTMTGIFHIAF
jgi:hypothetical protein